MQTILTYQEKAITLLSQNELPDPRTGGAYVRAYCPIHGSDHQRSLSIHRATGWGRCFNAVCQRRVLVTDWNPTAAESLMFHADHPFAVHTPSRHQVTNKRYPLALQPVLLHLPPETQMWQQDEQCAIFPLAEHLQHILTCSKLAQAYLQERGIPLQVALTTGVGYLHPDIIPRLRSFKHRALLRRWARRVMFPLVSPFGRGYIGRTLWRWKSGMDEQTHKEILEQNEVPKRWIKTNPAGWFSAPLDQLAEHVILVEGAFDRLTLLTAGFDANTVVALVGTAVQASWIPPQVRTITLALDGDEGGKEAAHRLADQLGTEGFNVSICPLPDDQYGKDWNERWRRIGRAGLTPLWEMSSLKGK